MKFAGLDIGSLSTETVIIDENGRMVTWDVSATGANSRIAAEQSFHRTLDKAGLSPADLKYTVASGYGRISVPFADKAVTEITCHGRGAHHLFPATRTIIDIGGQDSKVVRIDGQGRVVDFAMNDKCAAGTGRFLEVMARALEIDLEDMGPLSLESRELIPVSSMCTVFAESEVISLVAQARPKEDIINGIHTAICNRIASMLDRVGLEQEVTMTGGVAKNVGIVHKIEQKLSGRVNVPEEPQIVGALGAALIARQHGLA
ncbi:MAG: 2-hydroxyglutaryl-CoA dehydratase [Proteobacteria bacterium]|nr:2-hydroxyglutaryl-CoA dehydratase [Pseudomonadota bacterium]